MIATLDAHISQVASSLAPTQRRAESESGLGTSTRSDIFFVSVTVLDQLAEDDVYLIRYVTPAEIYEVPLSEFMRQSEKLEHFACGEDTFALPRGYWTTSSGARNHTLPLFSDTET